MDGRDAGFGPAAMTQKELDRLQQLEEEFNGFLRSQGNDQRVYLVAYSGPRTGAAEREERGVREMEDARGPGPAARHRRGCCR